ncbi:hypothetical protein ACKS0A_06091 [Histoplasma ohiense]
MVPQSHTQSQSGHPSSLVWEGVEHVSACCQVQVSWGLHPVRCSPHYCRCFHRHHGHHDPPRRRRRRRRPPPPPPLHCRHLTSPPYPPNHHPPRQCHLHTQPRQHLPLPPPLPQCLRRDPHPAHPLPASPSRAEPSSKCPPPHSAVDHHRRHSLISQSALSQWPFPPSQRPLPCVHESPLFS